MDDKTDLAIGAPILCELLVRHTDDAVVCRPCINALAMLAAHPDNLQAVVPAMPAVLSALQQHRSDLTLVRQHYA